MGNVGNERADMLSNEAVGKDIMDINVELDKNVISNYVKDKYKCSVSNLAFIH